MELVVVERVYEQPFTDQNVIDMARRAGPCFAIRRIKRLHSFISKDRRRTICLYEAPDASVVRDAHDQESIPYAKIWSADRLEDMTGLMEKAAAAAAGAPE